MIPRETRVALVLLLALLALNLLLNPARFAPSAWGTLIGLAAPLVCAAIASMPAILGGRGGIDVSVGPAMGFVNAVLIKTFVVDLGIDSAFVLVPVALLIGAAIGAVNGAIATLVRVQPIIATLGTYLVLAGLTLTLLPAPLGGAPHWLKALSGAWSILPLALLALAWFGITRLPLYDHLLATGSDDRAAYSAGIDVTAVRFLSYVMTGVFAGVAALMLTALIGSADPTIGPNFTLLAISSAALGGVSLAGGRGGLLAAAVGGIDIFLLQSALTYFNVSTFVLQIAYGLILVASICINALPATLPQAEGGMRHLAWLRVAGAFLVAMLLQATGTALIEGYSAEFAVRALLTLSALLAVASAGQTLVVILGGIDLSVPFVIGFANVVAAQLYGEGVPFPLVCAIVVVLAACIGAINGVLSAALRVHPLILTLGVGTAVQGAVLLWTAGFPAGSAPDALTNFVSIGAEAWFLPVPWVVPATVGLLFVLMLMLARTPFGRRLYALGANPVAARYALIGPIRMWTITYALSAVGAAVAGVLLLGFTGSAYADVGQPYLFQSIAAVVIGGTALTGGQGGFLGTVAGALVLTEINTLLIGLGLEPSLVQAALGAVIIALVSLYGRGAHVRTTI